jgi:hypothetical protein
VGTAALLLPPAPMIVAVGSVDRFAIEATCCSAASYLSADWVSRVCVSLCAFCSSLVNCWTPVCASPITFASDCAAGQEPVAEPDAAGPAPACHWPSACSSSVASVPIVLATLRSVSVCTIRS